MPTKSNLSLFLCDYIFTVLFKKILFLSRGLLLPCISFILGYWHSDLQSMTWDWFAGSMCDRVVFSFLPPNALLGHSLLFPTYSLFFILHICAHTFLPNFACLFYHHLFRLRPSTKIWLICNPSSIAQSPELISMPTLSPNHVLP